MGRIRASYVDEYDNTSETLNIIFLRDGREVLVKYIHSPKHMVHNVQ